MNPLIPDTANPLCAPDPANVPEASTADVISTSILETIRAPESTPLVALENIPPSLPYSQWGINE